MIRQHTVDTTSKDVCLHTVLLFVAKAPLYISHRWRCIPLPLTPPLPTIYCTVWCMPYAFTTTSDNAHSVYIRTHLRVHFTMSGLYMLTALTRKSFQLPFHQHIHRKYIPRHFGLQHLIRPDFARDLIIRQQYTPTTSNRAGSR
jgi:hypothetical protein